jgi:hypothetical protein
MPAGMQAVPDLSKLGQKTVRMLQPEIVEKDGEAFAIPRVILYGWQNEMVDAIAEKTCEKLGLTTEALLEAVSDRVVRKIVELSVGAETTTVVEPSKPRPTERS